MESYRKQEIYNGQNYISMINFSSLKKIFLLMELKKKITSGILSTKYNIHGPLTQTGYTILFVDMSIFSSLIKCIIKYRN